MCIKVGAILGNSASWIVDRDNGPVHIIDVPDFFFQRGGQTDPLEFRNFFSGRGSRGSRG